MKVEYRWTGVFTAAAAAAAFCWYLQREKPAPAAPPVARGTVFAPQSVKAPPDAAVKWPDRGTPEFKQMALERGRKWIESRGRDAASLIAMWDVAGEESLLAEAAKRFPDDPRVCLAMIHSVAKDAQKAMPWIERLIAAEPKNPEGFYLKSWALMTGGDRAGALAALRAAVIGGTSRDNHLRERIMSIREGALASGVSVGEASLLSLSAAVANSTMYTPFSSMGKIFREEMEEAAAAGEDDRFMETAGLGLAMAGQLSSAAGGVVVDALVGRSLENYILSKLSDDTEIGIGGGTVAQLRQEADARHQHLSNYLKQAGRMDGVLENSTDAVIADYTDRFLLHGEVAANTWLVQQADR